MDARYLNGLSHLGWDLVTQRWYLHDGYDALRPQSPGDLAGRVAFVTGGNAGIGRETVEMLARRGATVLLGCRDTSRGEQVARELRALKPRCDVRAVEIDLGSLASVRACARRLSEELRPPRLDMLVLNAGVMSVPLAPSGDGIAEGHFAVNHLGHFLLSMLLLPLLTAAPQPRIVTVSSLAYTCSDLELDDLNYHRRGVERYRGFRAYGSSKLCNVLFARELAARRPDLCVLAVHPGSVRSTISRHLESWLVWAHHALTHACVLHPRHGAYAVVYACVAPELSGASGELLWRMNHVRSLDAVASDRALAAELWDASVELCAMTNAERKLLPPPPPSSAAASLDASSRHE